MAPHDIWDWFTGEKRMSMGKSINTGPEEVNPAFLVRKKSQYLVPQL